MVAADLRTRGRLRDGVPLEDAASDDLDEACRRVADAYGVPLTQVRRAVEIQVDTASRRATTRAARCGSPSRWASTASCTSPRSTSTPPSPLVLTATTGATLSQAEVARERDQLGRTRRRE